MRRTVRPFIKEFKSRSLKSSATRPPTIDDADKKDSKPSCLDPSVFATRQNNPNDKYKAALKAADAVFGGGNLVVGGSRERSIIQRPCRSGAAESHRKRRCSDCSIGGGQ